MLGWWATELLLALPRSNASLPLRCRLQSDFVFGTDGHYAYLTKAVQDYEDSAAASISASSAKVAAANAILAKAEDVLRRRVTGGARAAKAAAFEQAKKEEATVAEAVLAAGACTIVLVALDPPGGAELLGLGQLATKDARMVCPMRACDWEWGGEATCAHTPICVAPSPLSLAAQTKQPAAPHPLSSGGFKQRHGGCCGGECDALGKVPDVAGPAPEVVRACVQLQPTELHKRGSNSSQRRR
jgi:hypothetical protein